MSRFSLIYIGSFLILLSIFSFFNIIYSYYFNIFLNVDAYTYSFFISLILGLFSIFFKKIKFKKISIFEKIITVLFGYLFFPLIISIPFYLSINNISFLNCYFEAISGFTSTGFTIFENIKQIDTSLILWRSTSQWIGGLYFLFSLLLLIDIFDENLKKSVTNYISFNSSEVIKQSLKIIILYALITIVIFLLLKLINLRTFDAFNFSFTIISSGGFLSINNFDNLFVTNFSKIILSVSILFSYFSLFFIYNLIFFKKRNINYLSEDFYLVIYLLIIISFIFVFFNFDNNFLNILVSIVSSVSNLGISFNDTPKNLSFIFLILVIIGGSFFSTSSGLRVIKVLSLIKFSLNNLLSHSKPKQVYLNKVALTKSNTNNNDINKYFLTIIIFLISLFTITLLLTISEIDLENAFKIGILTIMNTVNSSMYGVADFDFYNLSIFAKFTLILFMIIGRIELLTIFILFKKFLFKN
ncbi:MAG: TrkH family potassium uptake protein [Candidatus Pelagibacter sp.]